MLNTNESRSLILRAARIFLVRVEAAQAGPWTPREQGGPERVVDLTLRLGEVLKGTVRERPGDSIEVRVTQIDPGVGWSRAPGLWSNHPVDPGVELVAFGRAASEAAAESLVDPGGITLLLPAEALEDARLAMQAEAEGWSLAELLARARPPASALGEHLPEYFWARYGALAMSDLVEFDGVLDFLRYPPLSYVARTTLLTTLGTAVNAPEPPQERWISHLAIAMIDLVGLPEAADLHDNIVGTYLPSLLDLGDPAERPASLVFEDHADKRRRAASILASYRGDEPAAPLVQWLAR